MSEKFDEWDLEALNLDHGTVDGVRYCHLPYAPGGGKCRRCEAEKKLAQLGYILLPRRSRISKLLHELADLL